MFLVWTPGTWGEPMFAGGHFFSIPATDEVMLWYLPQPWLGQRPWLTLPADSSVPAVAGMKFSAIAEVHSSAVDDEGDPLVIRTSRQRSAVVSDPMAAHRKDCGPWMVCLFRNH